MFSLASSSSTRCSRSVYRSFLFGSPLSACSSSCPFLSPSAGRGGDPVRCRLQRRQLELSIAVTSAAGVSHEPRQAVRTEALRSLLGATRLVATERFRLSESDSATAAVQLRSVLVCAPSASAHFQHSSWWPQSRRRNRLRRHLSSCVSAHANALKSDSPRSRSQSDACGFVCGFLSAVRLGSFVWRVLVQ